MNVVTLIGRAVKDPQVTYTQGEKSMAIASFNIAVNRKTKNAEGKYDADFINCKAWGKTAELIAQYFTKGKEIYLQGRIEVTTSGEGENKRTYTNVVADRVEFCGSKGDSGQSSQQSQQAPQTEPQQADWGADDDLLPF